LSTSLARIQPALKANGVECVIDNRSRRVKLFPVEEVPK
jgi:hypothetical protein